VVVVWWVDWYVYGDDSNPDSSESDEDEDDAESSALGVSWIVGGRLGTGIGAAVRLCGSARSGVVSYPWMPSRQP
jgi:hypothetical protein